MLTLPEKKNKKQKTVDVFDVCYFFAGKQIETRYVCLGERNIKLVDASCKFFEKCFSGWEVEWLTGVTCKSKCRVAVGGSVSEQTMWRTYDLSPRLDVKKAEKNVVAANGATASTKNGIILGISGPLGVSSPLCQRRTSGMRISAKKTQYLWSQSNTTGEKQLRT